MFVSLGCGGNFGCDSSSSSSGTTGGGGTGGGGGGAPVTVSVSLPPGASLENAVLVTGHGETDVAAGNQEVTVNEAAPTLATVIDETNGKLLGLSLLRPGPAPQTINARSTAVALVHLAMGMSNEQTTRRTNLLDQLESSSGLNDLAAKIEAAWATDPYALENPSQDLKSAVEAAAASLAGAVKRPEVADLPDEPKSSQPAPKEAGEDIELDLPSDAMRSDQWISVRKTGNNIHPQGAYAFYNRSTRPGTVNAFVVTQDNAVLDPPALREANISLPFLPQYGGVLDYARSRDIPLQMAESIRREWYEAVHLSAVFDQPEPIELSQAKWQAHSAAWKQELRRLRQLAVVRIFADITLDLVGAGGQPYTQQDLESTLPGLKAAGSEMSLALDYASEPTGPVATLGQMLGTVANYDATARSVLDALRPVAGVNARYLELANLSTRRVASLRAALRVFDTFGLLGPLDSYGTTLRDLRQGRAVEIIKYSLARGLIAITPNRGTYIPGTRLTLRLIHGFTDPAYQARFEWEVDGNSCTVETIAGDQSGTTIETDKDQIFLRTGPQTNGSVLVSCKLTYLDENGNRVSSSRLAASAEFLETGTLPEDVLTFPSEDPNLFSQIVGFAYYEKEKLGRNRWAGGNFRYRSYKNGVFQREHNFTVPEFVGRPFPSARDFTRFASKLKDPEYEHLVVAYDLGDAIAVPIHTAVYYPADPNYTEDVYWQGYYAVQEGLEAVRVMLYKRP